MSIRSSCLTILFKYLFLQGVFVCVNVPVTGKGHEHVFWGSEVGGDCIGVYVSKSGLVFDLCLLLCVSFTLRK